METIKRTICLEDGISRKNDVTYGTLTASTFYTNIYLTQSFDNMGIYTDIEYVDEPVDYGVLINKLTENGYNFPFMNGVTPPSVIYQGFTSCTRIDGASIEEWYSSGDKITINTSSRINELRSYNYNSKFVDGFDVNSETYIDYKGDTINGVNRVVEYQDSGSTYVFDANNDSNIGSENQDSGLLYQDSGSIMTNLFGTQATYQTEGWNETNSSLSALTKEEYLMGILYPPEVFSDVFIERGATTVMEKHLRLSEINSLEQLQNYGNGYYNIVKI